tara:strand:- start:339 stop:578 length:240 start_codon:yes stop_codon:yes gene_type:complete
MANLTENYIENYIITNYGIMKHSKKAFNLACKKTAKTAQCKPIEIFHFIIENIDFNGFVIQLFRVFKVCPMCTQKTKIV